MAGIFDPKGKTFALRLKAFLDDVKATHNLSIGKDSGRTVDWQQKHHVAHMFLYNSYKSTKPAKVDAGKRTIAWSHFSDPKILWNTVKFSDFLRTAKNIAPIKQGQKWKVGFEPDQKATEKHVKSLQAIAGIGNAGKAMVSSGLKPCGQPCKCGAGRSKHLDGVASDLNSSHLTALSSKLTVAKAGTLDDYLAKFGLHRPLLNHATSPEKWHVESKP
ncbi:hypothetical protein MNBD_GAMMA04-276 [hydrothermal vent metagenome]|uniref:Uncharacterized protein n=1 Tax=hydrothermal vent metagenome TaxID=652676 RepID=A0A3B0W119_9ZZZZ